MLAKVDQETADPELETGHGAADDAWWKALTEKANAAYAREDLFTARLFYGESLAEAERLFQMAVQGVQVGPAPAAMIYVISSHNLAELELRRGYGRAAEVHLRRACARLMEGAQDAHAPVVVRAACMQHLKPALASLVGHYRASGAPESMVTDLLSAARKAVMSAFHAMRHAEIARTSCGHCAIALN